MGGLRSFLSTTVNAAYRISFGALSASFLTETIDLTLKNLYSIYSLLKQHKILILFAEKIGVFVVAAPYRSLRLEVDIG